MKIAVGGRDPVKPNADGVPAVQSSGARKLAGLSQGSVNGVIEGTDLTAAIPVTLVPMRSFVEVELVTFSWGGPYGRHPSDLLAGHTLWGTKPFSGDALLVDTSLFSPLLSEELWYRPVPPRGASAEEKQLLCSFRSDCVRARPGRRTHYSKSAPQELMGIAWPVGSIVTRVVADAGGFRAIASAVLLLSSGTALPLAN